MTPLGFWGGPDCPGEGDGPSSRPVRIRTAQVFAELDIKTPFFDPVPGVVTRDIGLIWGGNARGFVC